ncbi:hypothetical protein L5515_017287 [Caenorhabditis briggsae]|uniref:Protein kinase domain-containing protein n=1 Tax=Caenorhabditis briggsae TaxID=6238 RepID=A0AAE9JSF2_CAEBR|nr:hypothetical protein L5515_017287 [Caenorhabditis briggsae]
MATAQTKDMPLATTFDRHCKETMNLIIMNGTLVDNRFKVTHFAGDWHGEKCYYAEDLKDGQPVMLKAFSPTDSRIQAHIQLLTECAGTKGIPHLVARFQLLDHEFIAHDHKGVRFARILNDRFFRISKENTIRVGTRLLRILHAMHMKGFVHRDVRPLIVMCSVDHNKELQVGMSYFAHAATNGGAYGRVDDYISVVIIMMACQMVRPFDYNTNNHLTHVQKKEVFHENPYDALTPDTMWLGDIYLMLEEMRVSNSFRHLEIMCAMSRAHPGFDPNTPITYHYDQQNGHLLID